MKFTVKEIADMANNFERLVISYIEISSLKSVEEYEAENIIVKAQQTILQMVRGTEVNAHRICLINSNEVFKKTMDELKKREGLIRK